jgi:hypothetical protein
MRCGLIPIPENFDGGTYSPVKNPVSWPLAQPVDPKEDNPRYGSGMVFNNRFICQHRVEYDNAASNTNKFLYARSIDLETDHGTSRCSSPSAPNLTLRYNGTMGKIPAEWQPEFNNAKAFIGSYAQSIVDNGTHGISFYTFDPDKVGVEDYFNTIDDYVYYTPANPLIHPSYDNRLVNDYFCYSNQWYSGMFIPDGYRSLVTFHRHGYEKGYYWHPDADPPKEHSPCPTESSWGNNYEANPAYRIQCTLWDLNDFISARDAATPWAPEPYDIWLPDGPQLLPCAFYQKSGLAWDPATGNIYVSLYMGETVRILVYRLKVAGAPEPDKIRTGTFTVDTDAANPTYQWEVNRTDVGAWHNADDPTNGLSNISGANAKILTVHSVQASDAGQVRCKITDGVTQESNTTTITVNPDT